MASKKIPEVKEQEIEEKEPENAVSAEEKVREQEEEIRKLKAELEKASAGNRGGRQPESDAEKVRRASEEAAAGGENPWNVEVSIRVPRRPGREEPWYWLAVNGQSVQVPADDKYHELKLPWAECLIGLLGAERFAGDYQDSLEVYDPVTNPH